MSIFMERQARRTIITQGENTLEARQQAALARDQTDQARSWAVAASNAARSADALGRYYPTLAAAIAATAPDDAFTTTDSTLALAEGGTNTDGLMRACVRIDSAPYYAHIGTKFDPLSRTTLDGLISESRSWAMEASSAAISADALGRYYPTLAAAIAATVPGNTFTTSDVTLALAEGGANVGGFIRACTRTASAPYHAHIGTKFDPLSRANFDNLVTALNSVSVLITDYGASGTADCLAAFNAALTVVKEAGGGTIVFPYQGLGGWRLSDTARIDASNIMVALYDDVRLTKTTKAQCFDFRGTSDADHLNNVGIVCPARKCTVDGNGSNMTGYTYDTADGGYGAVHFFYCDGVRAENVHATNGLVNSLLVRRCTNITLTDCDGSRAVYDNGISVNLALNYGGYDASDPTTWTNARLLRCRGFNNNSVGITNYGGYGHTWTDCEAWGNGQDIDPSLPHGGGMTVEINGTYIRDSRTTIINPKCTANRNYDLLCSAPGVKVVKPEFKGTIAPVVVPDSTGSYGSSVIVFGNATVDFSGYGTISNPGLHGIRVLATGAYPSLSWDGQILNPGGTGIAGQGISSLEVSHRSVIDGAAVSGVTVVNGSAPYNAGGGEVRISGYILNCASIPIDITGPATATVAQLRLKNNRTGATAGSQVRFTSTTRVQATNIRNEDTIAKTQKIVEIRSTCVNGVALNVSGDSTTKTTMVDNSATNRIYTLGEDLGWDLILEEQAAAGTGGGNASAGRNTRPLGTTSLNRTALATAIGSSSFTLPAGTYRISAWAQAYKVDEHTLYLRDTTNGADITQGSTEFSAATTAAPSASRIDHVFTIPSSVAFALEHYCKTARAADGLGKAMTTQPGRFAWIGIRKLN